ncbi:MAG: ATP-dependent Lon protease [Actinomycetota bacterium]|nr:ATP-dependent Lon protease [Actinomycetota bacterium]
MPKPLPMFPLGTVLFPHATLPLHIFEERYRALAETCLRADGRFGVVLIERGHEVGGGDTRFGMGTVARIVDAARTPDGRYLLATVGTERFRIRKWLDDDPFPRAEIEVIGEPKRVPDVAGARKVEVQRLLGRVLALSAELGEAAAPVDAARLADDPVRASFEAAAAAPIGPLDSQRLLELDDLGERFDALEALLVDAAEVLELRLAGG